jgi:tripartite-type tricarboxylate transporter receptor subunit TctC
MRRRFWKLLVAAAAFCCMVTPRATLAENYPDHTVRIIVPYLPGGSADTLGRILAQGLQKEWNQAVIVENKPGAGTVLGASTAATSKPDGYTLYIASTSHTITPALYKSLSYDPIKSFAPISLIAESPILLLVNPASGLNSLADLTALAKKKPGGLNYGSPGVGTSPQLTGELYRINAGVEAVHIPFNGTSASTAALLGNKVDYVLADISALAMIRSGELRCLAATEHSPLLPDVPTFDQAGIAGVEILNWSAVVAPAGIDSALAKLLNEAVAKVVSSDDVRRGYNNVGFTPKTSSPQELQSYMASEIAKYAKIIETAGIKPQ